MNGILIEQFFFLNKAALFDLVSLFGIAGLIIFLFNIRFEHRFIAWCSGALMTMSLLGAMGLFFVENHFNQLARGPIAQYKSLW